VKIPLVDLKAQYATIREEIREAVDEVLESTAFVGGPAIARFEQAFASFCGAGHGVATSSGTTALHLAYLASGVGPGDEVIVPGHTFIATAEMVRLCGATLRFADIDEATYCLDPASVERLITKKTRLVVAVHLYGHPADMEALERVAGPRGVPVLEDAAQAHGAQYKGRPVGGLADLATFSFYPGKNLGAYGDAGIVTARSEEKASLMRRLSDHGRQGRYVHTGRGYNYRMDTLQAAVLLVKLRRLESWNAARRRWASLYGEMLAGADGIRTPRPSRDVDPAWHLYVVRVPNRDAVVEELHGAGIGVGVHYPVPLHLQPAYGDLGMREGDLPVTERVSKEVISLPIYPELGEDGVSYVAEALKKAVGRTSGVRT